MREYRLVDSPPYAVDPDVLGRFDQRLTAFALDWRASHEEPDVLGAARHAPRTDARARPPAEVIARVGRFVHDHFGRCFQGEHAAIDAGLGEMGRSGCLITPRFGPYVRICKVFTDMPLAADRPVEMGAAEACGACRLCAEAWPAGAISGATDPSFDTVCPANNPGVWRYPVDAVKCLAFWRRCGQNCSTCIAACPLTQDE